MTAAVLPSEPGWYWLGKDGWELVAPWTATIADVERKWPRCELLLVETADDADQVSLW